MSAHFIHLRPSGGAGGAARGHAVKRSTRLTVTRLLACTAFEHARRAPRALLLGRRAAGSHTYIYVMPLYATVGLKRYPNQLLNGYNGGKCVHTF